MGEPEVTHQLRSLIEQAWGKEIKVEYETSRNPTLKELFRNSSKRQFGNRGYPDLIIRVPGYPRLLILVECKRDLAHHQEKEKPKTSTNRPDKYACSGVVHYLESVYRTGKNQWDLLGIAYSGYQEDYTLDLYGLNRIFNQIEGTPHITHLGKELESALSQLYSPQGLDPEAKTLKFNQYYLCRIQIQQLIKLRESHAKFQRPVNNHKVDAIYKHHLQEYNRDQVINPLGILLIGSYQKEWYILDGQHRLAAYRKLCLGGKIDFQVAFQYREYLSEQQMDMDYLVHNQLTQTTSIQEDMARSYLKKPSRDREDQHRLIVIQTVAEVLSQFQRKYSAMFSRSRNCMRPHLNAQVFTEVLEEHLVNQKLWYNSNREQMSQGLLKALDRANQQVKKEKPSASGKQHRKAELHQLYLGLRGKSGWVDLVKEK